MDMNGFNSIKSFSFCLPIMKEELVMKLLRGMAMLIWLTIGLVYAAGFFAYIMWVLSGGHAGVIHIVIIGVLCEGIALWANVFKMRWGTRR